LNEIIFRLVIITRSAGYLRPLVVISKDLYDLSFILSVFTHTPVDFLEEVQAIKLAEKSTTALNLKN
jgi:hypothetical protein